MKWLSIGLACSLSRFFVMAINLSLFSSFFLHAFANKIDIIQAFDKPNIVPILVIGSGPAGLCSAIYGVRGNTKVLVVHGPLPGGLLTQTSEVENWPGSSSILGQDIIQSLQNQADTLADKYLMGISADEMSNIAYIHDTVAAIDISGWPYKVTTDDGLELHALTIIVATGASPKKLQVPGEHLAGVTSCARCDAPFYKEKDVVVVGGGDTAIEEAMQLAHHASTITILVRKDHMRASPLMQSYLKQYPTIKVVYNVTVQEIEGDDESGVSAIRIKHVGKNKQSDYIMPIQGVFLAIGHSANSDLVKDIVDIDEHGVIQLEGRSQKTSVPGIFAAGDVADKRYRQAGTAVGYGIGAAIDALDFLAHNGYTPSVAACLEKKLFYRQ